MIGPPSAAVPSLLILERSNPSLSWPAVGSARAEGVTILGHRWEVQVGIGGDWKTVNDGRGMGGSQGQAEMALPAGEASRTSGLLHVTEPTARARGFYKIRIEAVAGGGSERESMAAKVFEAEVGLLQMSRDGERAR